LAVLSNPVFLQPQEQDANRILQNSLEKIRQAACLSTRFVQMHHSPGYSKVLREAGTALFCRGNRMRWHYQDPENKFWITDGETIWTHLVEDQEVYLAKMDRNHAALAILTGGDAVEKRFFVSKVKSDPVVRWGNPVLLLAPRDHQSGFERIELEIDKESGYPMRITVFDISGSWDDFRFIDHTAKHDLQEEQFNFEIPADAEIIDLREEND